VAEPRGITPTLFSAQKLKIEFSLFHPTVIQQMLNDISPKIYYGVHTNNY